MVWNNLTFHFRILSTSLNTQDNSGDPQGILHEFSHLTVPDHTYQMRSCVLRLLLQLLRLQLLWYKYLGHWITNSRVPGSKTLRSFMVETAFHPSEGDQMSTRNSWRLSNWKNCFFVVFWGYAKKVQSLVPL